MTIEEIRGKGPSAIEAIVLQPPAGTKNAGTIAVLVDFNDLPESLHYLGGVLASALKREFYETSERASQRFTKALRAANEALAQEARGGVDQWIGTLRAIVVALEDTTLLLSSTGGCAALLLREGAVAEVPLEAGEGSRPFGAITSGELDRGDELFIASRTLVSVSNAENELSHNPKQFLAKIRRANGLACLYLRDDTMLLTSGVPILTTVSSALTRLSALRPSFSNLPALPRFTLKKPRARIALPAIPKISPALLTLPRFAVPKVRLLLRVVIPVGILFAVTGVALAVHSQQRQREETKTAALNSARSALEQGEAKTITGETEQAAALFTQGAALLQPYTDTNTEAEQLRVELIHRQNEISHIIPIETKAALDFKGFPILDAERLALVVNGETMIVAIAGSKHAAIWLNKALETVNGTFLFLPPPLKRGIRDLTLNDAGTLFALTDDGVAVIDATTRSAVATLQRSEAQPLAFITRGNDTVFALAPKPGVITILQQKGESVEERPWLKRGDALLTEAHDMFTLNGDILVLLNDNSLVRYRNGKRVSISVIHGFGWQGNIQTVVPENQNRLLALDTANGRLLLTTSSGDILQQFENSALREGRDMVISADSSTAYILTSAAILEVLIPH